MYLIDKSVSDIGGSLAWTNVLLRSFSLIRHQVIINWHVYMLHYHIVYGITIGHLVKVQLNDIMHNFFNTV